MRAPSWISLFAAIVVVFLCDNLLLAEQWAEKSIYVVLNNNTYVGIHCVLAKKVVNGAEQWKVMRKGEAVVKLHLTPPDDESLGQLAGSESQLAAVKKIFNALARDSPDKAKEMLNALPLVASNKILWSANVIGTSGAIVVSQGFEAGLCLKFDTPWQLANVAAPSKPLVYDKDLDEKDAWNVPDSRDDLLKRLAAPENFRGKVLIVPSPAPDWTNEALIIDAGETQLPQIVRISYQPGNASDRTSITLMFDRGKGVAERLGVLPDEYALLRSVAFVPRRNSGKLYLNTEKGWEINSGDNAALLEWTPQNSSQRRWLQAAPLPGQVSFQPPTGISQAKIGCPDFNFQERFKVQVSSSSDDSADYQIFDGELFPKKLVVGTKKSVPFALIVVAGKPVYMMTRELTFHDLLEFVRDGDPDQVAWWRTKEKRLEQLTTTARSISLGSAEESQKLQDSIVHQWQAIEDIYYSWRPTPVRSMKKPSWRRSCTKASSSP